MRKMAFKPIKTPSFGVLLVVAMVLGFAVPASADTQMVRLVPVSVGAGEAAEFAVVYDVAGDKTATTGLGLRIHYNSKAARSVAFKNLLDENLLAYDTSSAADVEDFDGDAATDRYINIAWMDIDGNWPSSKPLPAELATVVFELQRDADPLRLNVSASGTAAGFEFAGQGY
jgi:hypothetical protein